MKHTLELLAALIIVAAATFGAVFYFTNWQPQPGNVITQGIVPKVATQSDVAVGPQASGSLSAASSNCTARVISTASTSLMLSFLSTYTPVNGTKGVWQPASTTVSYDNAVYGCGAISGFASASSTVNVTTLTQ